MLTAMLVTSLLTAGASASAPTRVPDSPSAITQNAAKKKKVIRLDAITVEGRIQKPQAFYILQRSNLNFDELNKNESFVPKVVKSVEKTPF